jgi:hypothetical protein
MNQDKFTSLIDSLAESVNTDYKLDDSFDHWNAINEICANSCYSFAYGNAWTLVDFIRFSDRDLFDQAEKEVQDNDHNTDDINLNDYMLSYSFQILQIATLKKWEEMQIATTKNV